MKMTFNSPTNESENRIVTAPDITERRGLGIISVRVSEFEDVEWTWTTGTDGNRYVSGYTIREENKMRTVTIIVEEEGRGFKQTIDLADCPRPIQYHIGVVYQRLVRKLEEPPMTPEKKEQQKKRFIECQSKS